MVSTNPPGAIIGLTGGIATGKSTVADIFTDLGVVVLDADVLARQIVEPGQPAFVEIVDTFGDPVVADDGTLDRTRLGEIIFRDDDARRKLEAITHPGIARAMFEGAQEAFSTGHDWIIYDAALLVETGTHRMLDALIVVHCSPQTQLQRLLERDDISEDEAKRRIASQMPLDEKRRAADFVIDNDGSVEQTRDQVRRLKRKIDELIAVHGTATPQEDHHG